MKNITVVKHDEWSASSIRCNWQAKKKPFVPLHCCRKILQNAGNLSRPPAETNGLARQVAISTPPQRSQLLFRGVKRGQHVSWAPSNPSLKHTFIEESFLILFELESLLKCLLFFVKCFYLTYSAQVFNTTNTFYPFLQKQFFMTALFYCAVLQSTLCSINKDYYQ